MPTFRCSGRKKLVKWLKKRHHKRLGSAEGGRCKPPPIPKYAPVCKTTNRTFGVHGSPFAGWGVDGRGGVGGRSSSLPWLVSTSPEMSSSPELSNGSSRLVCFISPCCPPPPTYQRLNNKVDHLTHVTLNSDLEMSRVITNASKPISKAHHHGGVA